MFNFKILKGIFSLFIFLNLAFSGELYVSINTTGLNSDIDKKIIRFVNNNQITGLSIAVIKEENIIWEHNYGWANMEEKIPINNFTYFRIASVSKIITLTALMQLYEKGMFKLDDDVSKYLGFALRNPNYPEISITFKHLINHTAGINELASNYETFLESTFKDISNTNIKELLTVNGKYYSKNIWGTLPPGSQYIYSNLAYGIIATLIERLSGIRFDKYCNEFIFKPLKMHASFNISDITVPYKKANIYKKEAGSNLYNISLADYNKQISSAYYNNYAIGTNGCFFSPHGGLRTNAHDLSPMMIAFLNGGVYKNKQLLQSDTIKYMKSNPLGLVQSSKLISNKVFWGHSGAAYGLISHFYFNPNDKIGIIFIINGTKRNEIVGDFYQIEKELSTLLYDNFI